MDELQHPETQEMAGAELQAAPPQSDADAAKADLAATAAQAIAEGPSDAAEFARPKPAPDRATDLLFSWLRDLVVAGAVSAFIILFLYQPVKVEGTSMEPGLDDAERIFINKFVYRLEPISRGDVVVFKFPRDTRKSYIKRVIGVPGDVVRIDRGQVFVNSQPLAEPYVADEYFDHRTNRDVVVPENSYFVLGDHRNRSSDSRDFGVVSKELIVGKAVFGYWPLAKLGKVK